MSGETPEQALVRYSRRDFVSAATVGGVLAALGIAARPRAAKAAPIQRLEEGATAQQINAQVVQANSAGAPLIFAPGVYRMGQAKMEDITNIPYFGGEVSSLQATTIIFGNTGTSRAVQFVGGGQGERAMRAENLLIVGPGPNDVTKGQDHGTQIGVSVGGDTQASKLHFRARNFAVERFHVGIAVESLAGHVFFEHSGTSKCSFGYWMRRTTGAYSWIECDDRNMAKATYLFSQGELLEHALRIRGHISHTPYVFYRTSDVGYRGGIGPYMLRSSWTQEQVEWLGNSMAYSEVGGSGIEDSEFAYGSQTYSPSQIWPGRAKDWLWDVGYLRSTIFKGGAQLESGAAGLIRVSSASKIALEGKKPPVTTTSGPITVVDRSL